MTKSTGIVRLVDKKTRVVELFGPEPPGARRPTDRDLLFELYAEPPRRVGHCFAADERTASSSSTGRSRPRSSSIC